MLETTARDANRIIPACAGNGFASSMVLGPWADHPRVCGERRIRSAWGPGMIGSSPRVRGTAAKWAMEKGEMRIIPACAGNGSWPAGGSLAAPDHPRVCGERFIARDASPISRGSSPRVRGTGFWPCRDSPEGRIIPACAGNGCHRRNGGCLAADHPRVCGERKAQRMSERSASGSSPRVRGTAVRLGLDGDRSRIIPACAGNGASRSRMVLGKTDHPRVCGERPSRISSRRFRCGSSPRVRGTDVTAASAHAASRIIPACAGNGPSSPVTCIGRTDHPRVCGERGRAEGESIMKTGSSPRVRGTVSSGDDELVATRIIPACAGNGMR